MLYLDSIVVHNFKSFKHTSVKFLKGFNCIVGPNGSGKSNVVDSILFALGESSLRRMRVTKAEQLINGTAKHRSDGTKRAYVKLLFTGDTNAEVSRIIKSNGKIGYKINNKRATRQEVIDFLRSYHSSADETNVIAQGEINKMQNLNPRERRELIEIAAGIREFDEKKNASLKELEKVDTKLRESQIELGMKKGFLADIEKQKDDAESYLSYKDYVTRGTFTILKSREAEVATQYEAANRDIKAIDERIAKLNEDLLKIEGNLTKLTAEKAGHVKELNEKSIETSSASRKLEEVEKELAVKETESRSIKERIGEKELFSDAQIRAISEFTEKLEGSSKEIEEIKIALKEKKTDKRMEKMAQFAAEQGGADSVLELYSKTQKEIFALQEKLSTVSSDLARINAETQASQSLMQSISNELKVTLAEEPKTKERAEALEKEAARFEKEAELARKKVAAAGSAIVEARKRIDEIDSRTLELRSQLAMSGAGQDKRADDELARSLKSGFYGRAHELLSYNERYDAAVSAAAGTRLNYFVVDSAEVAEKAIETIKAKKLGRAAFIPLADIVVNERKLDSKLDALISHVEYDAKYEKAFRYIFSDTYVVNSILEAKKSGIGRNRFVTYGGELVESSGIISGGDSGGRRMSASSLQSKIVALQKDREAAVEQMNEFEIGMTEAKKALSDLESTLISNTFEKRSSDEAFKIIQDRLAALKKNEFEVAKRLDEFKTQQKRASEEESKLSREIERLGKIADEALKKSKEMEGPKESRQRDLAEYKAVMEEVEKLKISLAELQKEEELGKKNMVQVEAELGKAKGQIKDDRRKLALLDEEMMNLKGAKHELNEEIKVRGAKYGALISKMKDVDDAITKAGEERGRKSSEMSRTEREVAEISARRAQSQMRLADIKAELATYQNTETIVGEEIKHIEEKVNKAKYEIERLGAVNLKAPEEYKARGEEVLKAEEKMGVLVSEKESIMNLIKEIDARKLSVFKDTFNQVNDSFKSLHNYIFGGSAYLQLDSQKEPLDAGLNIVVEEGRNKNLFIEQFSGGEKTLLVLILLFSIQMRKPQAFYLFDEIDASLDKENAKKLSKLLGQLSKSSQLIVVSHNDTMITAADSAIGVVRRAGESNVVGLQMTDGTEAIVPGA